METPRHADDLEPAIDAIIQKHRDAIESAQQQAAAAKLAAKQALSNQAENVRD